MTAQPVRLADCITLTKGKPPAEIPYFGDDAEPYLSPEYLRGKGTAEPAKPAANAVRVVDGDTILLWDGSNAGEFFRGRKGLLSSTMTHIGHREEFEPEYFYYAAKRWEAYLKSQTSGSGIPHVDKEVLGKLEILQLAPGEQRLVADVLAKIDRAIEQTEAIIAKQQRVKTGLMQDLLTKGIDEHGNIRSEATHEFKDSPLGRIPVEWEAKLLDDCVRPDAPICYGILMPGTGVDDGVPVIKVKDIFGGVICLDNILLTDPRIDAAYKRSRLRQGDLLVTIRGTTGRVAVVPAVLDRGNITQDTARIRLKEEYLPSFMFYVLQSEKVQSQVDLQTLGQAVKGINIADVRKLRVPTPHPDEQLRICRILDGVNTDWQTNIRCKDKLNLQKIGLMRDLLTGKVRVTNLLPTQATHG